jgi:hypothetical protein
MAVFYKIVKLAKNGVLMIIHIYAKVSNNIIYINTAFEEPAHDEVLVAQSF